MSLVNDALNQLPDKAMGSGHLKSPYSNPISRQPFSYKLILVVVLILIIIGQLSYMVVTGKFSSQRQPDTELSVNKPVPEAIETIIVNATGAISQPITSDSDISVSSEQIETNIIAAIPTQKSHPDPENHVSPESGVELQPEQTDNLKLQIPLTNKVSNSQFEKTDNPAGKTPKLVQSESINNVANPNLAEPAKASNKEPQIKPLNTSIIKADSSKLGEDQVIRLAFKEQKRGNIDAAFDVLSKALESEPDNLTIRLAMSKLWLNQKEPEKAQDLVSNRNEPEAIALQALIFETMQNTEKAKQLYQQLAESNDLLNGYQLRYAVLLENTRDTKRAYMWYQKFSENRENRKNLRVFAAERMKSIINAGQL